MSLKKQMFRQYGSGNRAHPSSLLTSAMINDVTEKAIISPSISLLPSIEESLQDWFSKGLPSDNLPSDLCPCCQKDDCQQLEKITNTIHKLENDAHLAAVIGQDLLQKHAQTTAETNLLRFKLKQEKEMLQKRIDKLEHSLFESDSLKTEYFKENDRLIWELQRAQKSLEETTADLESCNSRFLQLDTELKLKTVEIEKLKAFELMARQSDVTEEMLRTRIGELEQELATSRKAELSFELKYKKLESKYCSMSAAFEKLKLTQKELGITDEHQIDMVWLKESNEKLRKDVLKLTYALLSPNAAADLQITNSNQNHLIELIKELASANNKLKSDLLDCSNLLMECRSDLYAKIGSDEQHLYEDKMEDEQSKTTLFSHLKSTNDQGFSALLPMTDTMSQLEDAISEKSQDKQDETVLHQTSMTPLPEGHNIPPVIHHHYHYYTKRMMSEKGKSKRKRSSVTEAEEGRISITSSSSSSSTKTMTDTSPPFHQLCNQVTIVLQRLQQTDIRALNRRLRRTFDIFEMSTMSNSIIENIVTDVNTLKSQFGWVEDKLVLKQDQWAHDVSMSDFFPTVEVIQSMLKEIGQLRTTINDLQLEYVKKIEENDSRLERELLRKQQPQKQLQQQAQSKPKVESRSIHPIHWLTNIFNRNRFKPNATTDHQERSLQGSALHGSFYTHFLTPNNNSSISIYSKPVHPYTKIAPMA